jgi:Fe-S cluster biogenesis protein NfuA
LSSTPTNTLETVPETSPIAETELEPLRNEDMAGDAGSAGASDGSSGSDLYDQVAEVVKIIRPAVQADDGDIFLRGVDEESGVVSVELVGACVTCPASTQTLKQGLERILKQRVEGVTEVEHVGATLVGYDEGTPVSL